MSRAVITGMGLVCALGINRQEVMNAVRQGRSGLTSITSMDLNSLSTQIGGEVRFSKNIEFPSMIKEDKSSRMAYLAFSDALKDSGLQLDSLNSERLAITFGTCNGSVQTLEQHLKDTHPDRHSQYPYETHFNAADFLIDITGAKGSKTIFVTACAASNQAIGYALDLISNDDADVVIVGGSDSFSLATFAGFHALQSLHPTGTAPFSQEMGISLGEGAGFLILESESHALERQATIHGEVLSYAFRGDAYHTTSPDVTGDGARRTMEDAIKSSGLKKSDITVVCAHGTGTEANDKAETLAIRNCFEADADKLTVTSTKSLYGHTLGAAGVTQAILMLDCMKEALIPPIINFTGSREGCDLNYVQNAPKRFSYRHFISNSFAFGGNNVSVVFGKYEPKHDEVLPKHEESLVVTDFDFVMPFASDLDTFKSLMLETAHEHSLPSKFQGFSLSNPRLRKFGKAPLISKLAIEVADRLLNRSKPDCPVDRIGILMGILKGPIKSFDHFYSGILTQGIALGSALDFPHVVMNSTIGQVSIALGIKGVNTVVSGQFSPFEMMAYSEKLLQKSQQDAILITGCDEDEDSDGAATIMVETENSAKARNAPILAEFRGVSSTSFSSKDNHSESILACIQETLRKTATSIDEIDLHIGCSTEYDLHPILDQPFLTTQYLSTMGATTAMMNIILGICLLTDVQFAQKLVKKPVKTILLSAISNTGNCYSVLLTRPHRKDLKS